MIASNDNFPEQNMATEGTNDETTIASRGVSTWTVLVCAAVALLTWCLAVSLTSIGFLGQSARNEYQLPVSADTPPTIATPADDSAEVQAWSNGRSAIAVKVEPTSDHTVAGQFVDVFVTTQVDGKSESKLVVPHVIVLGMGGEARDGTVKALAMTSDEITRLQIAVKEGSITLRLSNNKK